MSETINQKRVPWICKECWEYLADNELGDTCRHCKALQESRSLTGRPWYRYGQRPKAWGGGWYAHEVSNLLLIFAAICGAVSILMDIFFWRPL